jgi:hypothetical protein
MSPCLVHWFLTKDQPIVYFSFVIIFISQIAIECQINALRDKLFLTSQVERLSSCKMAGHHLLLDCIPSELCDGHKAPLSHPQADNDLTFRRWSRSKVLIFQAAFKK